MELFEGGSLEIKVMEKVGCLKYSATKWESDKSDEYQRQIHYKFSKKLSPVGGEVTGSQLKSPMPNKKGWIIEEVMELQGVLLGDFFTVCIQTSNSSLPFFDSPSSLGYYRLSGVPFHRGNVVENT
jgi:hypothetical protein